MTPDERDAHRRRRAVRVRRGHSRSRHPLSRPPRREAREAGQGRALEPAHLAGDAAPARRRGGAGGRHQGGVRPGVLHPVGVDGARAGRERPDPGPEVVLLDRRRPSAATSWCSRTRAAGWAPTSRPARPTAITKALAKVGLFPDGGHLVKRVIGVEGDVITCCDEQGRISVNGVAVDESDYVKDEAGVDCAGPMTGNCDWTAGPVPEGHVFVMGDNRAHSADSTVHMCTEGETDCVPGPRVRRRRPGRGQGVRCSCGPSTGSARLDDAERPRRRPRRRVAVGRDEPAAPGCDGPAGRRPLRLRARPAPARHRADRGRRRGRPGRLRRTARRRRRDPAPGQGGHRPRPGRLQAAHREGARARYAQIVRRAVAWSVVVVSHEECDRLGMHVANVEALRRAVAC